MAARRLKYRLSVVVVLGLSVLLTGKALGERRSQAGSPLHQVYELVDQGNRLVKDGKYVQARPFLEQAAAFDPSQYSATIHDNLGYVFEKLGNPQQALMEYQLALRYDPAGKRALWGLASCYHDLGDYARAMDWAQRYLDSGPKPDMVDAVHAFMERLKGLVGKQGLITPSLPDYFDAMLAEGELGRWPAAKMPLKIFVASGQGVMGYKEPFRDFLIEAFDRWAKASGYRVGYTIVDDRDAADIICRWTSNPAELEERHGHSAGVTFRRWRAHPDGINEIVTADIVLLPAPRSTAYTLTEEGFKITCLHEVGHALGLGSHSYNPSDVMFYSESARRLPGLTRRDKATIQRLYNDYRPLVPQAQEHQ